MIRYMREGNTAPPSDWVEKRQWSHDLMSMLTDTNKKPPRTTTVFSAPIFSDGPTTRKEIKPSMPLSGRVCPAFLVQEQPPSSECSGGPLSSEPKAPSVPAPPAMSTLSTPPPASSTDASVALTEIKEEPVNDNRMFSMMLSNQLENVVIDLDSTPSPPPAKKKRNRSESDDGMPEPGENPEE